MMSIALTDWLAAIRLRTLPLAISSVWCGALLAELNGYGDSTILYWSIFTAVSLQIFSNLANDYGDACNGADHYGRQGPPRMVAAGRISAKSMRGALWLFGLVCCSSGLYLLAQALPNLNAAVGTWLGWLLLGVGCLAAAFYYTAGSRPYGYRGWGDGAVFLFFGLIGVLGTEYLHAGLLNQDSWMAAAGLGLWCSMVLNLNNMRDIESDLAAEKYTLAARLGLPCAKAYHSLMALFAWLLWWAWLPLGQGYLIIFSVVATMWHLYWLYSDHTLFTLDKLLPQWSLTVLAWVALLWLMCV